MNTRTRIRIEDGFGLLVTVLVWTFAIVALGLVALCWAVAVGAL